MTNLAILLQLNGHWDSVGRYNDFNVDGIVVSEDSNYNQLNYAIAEHLMINTSEKIIKIKYIVNERCPPMEIRNDIGVRVYMETKKENRSLGMYPLCSSIQGNNVNKIDFLFATCVIGSILPLAYVVVGSEDDAAWNSLFEQFKDAYGKKPNMCVVSDRNESILKATSIVYTRMPHYACMWHIWTNIRSKFKKDHLKLSELYFATTRSYTIDEFNERMSKIEEIDVRVKAYLYDIGYHRWSWVHATVNRTWTMTSNIAESLNAVTRDARELPILDLLEYMRTFLESWNNEKLLKVKGTFTYLGEKYNKELEDNRTLSQKMRVRASTDHIHTVLDGAKRFIVCLQNKRCCCGQFQLDELSCPHALAALRHRDESYENYCSPYYTRESLLKTYETPVDPLPDESKWNVS
ncbi:uncharacterized protein [Nicotiana sylvestris]|uniref:Uncharacterized protein LOC104240127 n=1 Tax=Nicotiana sylvestris TaxID=4096 RepID=A0A1U7XMD8_NICSY|nr:PREDICTED: uncharacterized protein LOC104240127 [Nicotiana sylvestris]